jgi:hypothetical protein
MTRLTGSKAPKKAVGSKTEGFEEDESVGLFQAKKAKAPEWANVINKAMVLSYLLWYFNNTSRCTYHSSHSSLSKNIHKDLQDHGLVNLSYEDDEDEPDTDLWTITEKGCALVRHIMDLPLPKPVTTWSMPEKES